MAFPTFRWYVHKFSVSLAYGGSEEGGWWYTEGVPVRSAVMSFDSEEAAEAACRDWNANERLRRENDEEYDFHSVLSHRSNHYEYDVSTSPEAKPFPEHRPHYE